MKILIWPWEFVEACCPCIGWEVKGFSDHLWNLIKASYCTCVPLFDRFIIFCNSNFQSWLLGSGYQYYWKLWLSWRSSVLDFWCFAVGDCDKSKREVNWIQKDTEGTDYQAVLGTMHVCVPSATVTVCLWLAILLQKRKCVFIGINDDREEVGTTGILLMVYHH